MLEVFAYRTVTVVHFTDQGCISKTVYLIRCAMVCKIYYTNWNAKVALLRSSMVVTYYIKLFRTGVNRQCFNVSSPSSRRDNNVCQFTFDNTVIDSRNVFVVPVYIQPRAYNTHWSPKSKDHFFKRALICKERKGEKLYFCLFIFLFSLLFYQN